MQPGRTGGGQDLLLGGLARVKHRGSEMPRVADRNGTDPMLLGPTNGLVHRFLGDAEQARLFPPWEDAQAMVEWDDKLAEAVALAEGRDRISTSFVQRRLHIGFPRAARLTDQMEELGIVGPDEGGGRGREVFLGRVVDLEEIAERLPGVAPD